MHSCSPAPLPVQSHRDASRSEAEGPPCSSAPPPSLLLTLYFLLPAPRSHRSTRPGSDAADALDLDALAERRSRTLGGDAVPLGLGDFFFAPDDPLHPDREEEDEDDHL